MKLSISLGLVIILQAISLSISSQNLIPNPSFEDGECPSSFTRKAHEFKVSKWHMPDSGTPDYFHRCAEKDVGIPVNWASVREPAAGDAYIGIYLKKGIYQENIGTKLKETLRKGVTYHGRISIATVANSEFFPCGISFSFTDNPLHIDLTSSFDNRQITIPFPAHEEFMDFSWQILEFSYIAKGGEKYLYTGSLTSNAGVCKKNKYRIRRESMLKNASYVFLDDFYLGEDKDYQEPVPVFEFAEEIVPVKVYFDFDADYLLPNSISALDSLSSALNNTKYHLLITGGTDSLGTDNYNQALGFRRAESVRSYLIFEGMDTEKIGIKSIGEDNPIYPNHNEEDRSLNRSALIEFYREKITEEN